ncbi:hypothetical protein GPALN_004188 [Globodera pallida]|nr:hypothetical protein GPALN_004188 [Globodera pallida]
MLDKRLPGTDVDVPPPEVVEDGSPRPDFGGGGRKAGESVERQVDVWLEEKGGELGADEEADGPPYEDQEENEDCLGAPSWDQSADLESKLKSNQTAVGDGGLPARFAEKDSSLLGRGALLGIVPLPEAVKASLLLRESPSSQRNASAAPDDVKDWLDFSVCFEMGTLTSKALIFVSGIGDSDRDLREKCLNLMEEAHLKNTPIRFASLVEECRTALSLRSSAAALSRPMGPNTNVAIRH